MKKGFTLTEIAVVIVLIGLLSAISLKSYYMVTTARIKREAHKVQEFRVALNSYLSIYINYPDEYISTEGMLDLTPMVESQNIAYGDNNSKLDPVATYYIHKCTLPFEGMITNDPDNSMNYCFSSKQGSDTETYVSEVRHPIICSIESSYDDSNLNRGNGRFNGQGTADTYMFDTCYRATANNATGYSYLLL